MLDTETIKSISTFVEITMQVEAWLRSKYEQKEEQLAEEIDKLRAGAADPRWIPMSEKRPCGGATVIVCTKRGVVDVATETVDGWKRSTGKIAEPVAWMPLPVRYTGGEA